MIRRGTWPRPEVTHRRVTLLSDLAGPSGRNAVVSARAGDSIPQRGPRLQRRLPRLIIAVALVLMALETSPLAASAAAPPSAPADPFHLKPGATGKLCLTCHEAFKDTLALPFVHTPVKSGACSDCHSPHASAHGALLAAGAGEVCGRCHAGTVPPGSPSVHKVVLEGGCVKCHDPHGSKNKGNLLQAGNDLCLSCHKDIAAALAANRFQHAPVEKGCLACHAPHASKASGPLLRKSVPALCADCHKTDQPIFVKQHMNYPVGTSDCTSCHDPHGSSNKGILWASVHPPVATKMCAQCHPEPTSPDALKPKKSGLDLCRACHSSMMNDMLARARPHWPVLDRKACLNCHSPHASRVKPLLTAAPKALCGACHADTIQRQARSLVKHPPAEGGECAICHAPHGSDNDFLFTNASVFDLCGACHEWQRHSSHPIGDKVLDKRNKNLTVDCLSCHRTHGSPFKSLAHYDTKAELCVQCHEDLRR